MFRQPRTWSWSALAALLGAAATAASGCSATSSSSGVTPAMETGQDGSTADGDAGTGSSSGSSSGGSSGSSSGSSGSSSGSSSGAGTSDSGASDEAATPEAASPEAATPEAAPPPPPNTPLHWSATYTVGWTNFSPSLVPWASVTHLMHFAITANADGSVNTAWFQAVPNQSSAMCAAAHAHNRKCMLTVGGYGYGPGYAAATAPAVRPTLEANMIAYMQANGYDGIDLDWEDAMVPSQYLALAQELRAKFDTMSPKPLFSMATACWIGVDPNMFQYFDFMNVMSYTEPVSGLGPDFSCYSGVPASKLGVGMGLGDSGGVDTTPAAVKAKCDYAVANGYGGVMQWLLEDDYTANGPSLPLMAVIAPYVPVP